MKTLYRTISILALAATAFAGCQEKEAEFPGIKFSRTGEVSLIASIENADVTKASLVGTGEARWLREDRISVLCDDNSSVEFALDGTGETRKAFFKGEIPSGRTMGNYAWYPHTVAVENGKLQYELPSVVNPGNSAGCALMVAEIKDSYNIEFKQSLAYLNLSISNIGSNVATVELRADNCISGLFSLNPAEILENGVAGTGQSNKVQIALKDDINISLFLPIPAGEYKTFTAVGLDSKGREITKAELLNSTMNIKRGEYRNMEVKLPDAEAPVFDSPVTLELPMDAAQLPNGFPTSVATSGIGEEKSWFFTIDGYKYTFAFDSDAAGQNQVSTQSDKTKPGYYFDSTNKLFVLGSTYGYIRFPALKGVRLEKVIVSVVNGSSSTTPNPVKSCIITKEPCTLKVGNDAFLSDIDSSGPVYISKDKNSTSATDASWNGPDHTWTFPEGENGTAENTSYCFQSRNGQVQLAKLILHYVPVTRAEN